MSTTIRIAIRFGQVVALALLLVAVAGGATVARAAQVEVDCDEAAPWTADTLARWKFLDEHGTKIEKAMIRGNWDQATELYAQAIVLLEQAADDQADSDPPAGLEDLNDDLADSYAAAAAAVTDFLSAYFAFDQSGMFDAYDELAAANMAALESLEVVAQIAEACEGKANESGRDRDRDRDRRSTDEVEIELTGEVVDEENGDPLRKALVLVFQEGLACDKIDFEALFDGDSDQVLLAVETDRRGEFEAEAEIEVEGEYAILVIAEDYQAICLDGLTFAEDEDVDEFDFGTIELEEA